MKDTIPETMKAVVTVGHGGLDRLQYRDVPVPRPDPGEVLVKVGACGLNNTDIWVREGAYGNEDDPQARTGWNREPQHFPRIQGADIAGRVVAVAEGVAQERIGERVIVNLNLYNEDDSGIGFWGYIGAQRDGGYAEYAAVPGENAHAIDSPLSDAELATFPCSCLTAEAMLDRARVEAGQHVLITGASGGVGSALIQLARARGARTIAVTSPGKMQAITALGADWVVSRDCADLKQEVRQVTGLADVDVAADVVGGAQFSSLIALVAEEGAYVTSGAIAGPIVELDLRSIYLRHRTIYGTNAGRKRHFDAVYRHIVEGALKPLLARTFPLSCIREAQQAFMSKTFVGNIVVIPEH